MHKIKLFLSKDFKVFLPILSFLTWSLSIFTFITFLVTVLDCAIKNSLTFPSPEGINTFLSAHQQFKELYGATVALVIAYIAVKQYLHSNTLQTLDFFFEKLVPAANDTISSATKKLSKKLLTPKLLEYLNNNQSKFTVEELAGMEPELYTELLALHLDDSEFQAKSVITLGYFESFSVKLTRGLVDEKLIEKACSKAFCVQVRTLYPLFSITRNQNDQIYFTTVVSLFNKWKPIIKSRIPYTTP